MSAPLFLAFLFALMGGISLNAGRRMTGPDAAAYWTLGCACVFVCIVLLGIAALRWLFS